jgi:hypothetical protein
MSKRSLGDYKRNAWYIVSTRGGQHHQALTRQYYIRMTELALELDVQDFRAFYRAYTSDRATWALGRLRELPRTRKHTKERRDAQYCLLSVRSMRAELKRHDEAGGARHSLAQQVARIQSI